MAVSDLVIDSRTFVSSRKDRSHSSSWPSLTMASKTLPVMALIFSGSGRARLRAAASHEFREHHNSHDSLNCGFGPA